MFTNIKIKNFKAFKNEQSIRIAPITLIYGPNSAGKSSIIQSMLLLNQSMKNIDAVKNLELTPKGPHLDLGIPKNYLHKGNVNLPLEFSFASKIKIERIRSAFNRDLNAARKEGKQFLAETRIFYKQEDVNDPYSALKIIKVSYKLNLENTPADFNFTFIPSQLDKNEFILERKKDAHSLASLLYGCGGEIMRMIRSPNSTNTKDDVAKFTLIQASNLLATATFSSAQFAAMPSTGFFPTYLPRANFFRDRNDAPLQINDEITGSFNRLMSSLNDPIVRTIRNSDYISGLRNSPQRFYSLTNAKDYVGKSGEDMATLLYRLKKTQKSGELNKWLKNLDIPYSISIEPVKDNLAGSLLIIKLKDLRNNVEVTPSDVGIGISQILPLLIQGLSDMSNDSSRSSNSRVGGVNYVEQPELHLHPRLQANLADFFIESTRTNKQITWLLETHSEALMLRLQRRIRNQELNPEMVAVQYVNRVKGGHSEVMELRLDRDGDFIDEWPNGFFEEAYKEKFLD